MWSLNPPPAVGSGLVVLMRSTRSLPTPWSSVKTLKIGHLVDVELAVEVLQAEHGPQVVGEDRLVPVGPEAKDAVDRLVGGPGMSAGSSATKIRPSGAADHRWVKDVGVDQDRLGLPVRLA